MGAGPRLDEESGPDAGASVRARATAAVGTFGLRGVAAQALSFAGGLVLARFLVPREFGVVALGTALASSLQFLSDGGLGVALIRQKERIERLQLEAVLGLQIVVAVLLAVGVALVGIWFGEVGRVTAVIAASIPFVAWRGPGSIRLERDLRYRPLAYVTLVDVVAFYAWSIPGVALGWGVWALATGMVFRAVAAVFAQEWLLRDYRIRPKLKWEPLRPLLGFGMQFIGGGAAILGRDQGLNFGISAVGGLGLLGLWSFASRLLQPISLLYSTLWRVTYPTMSRLLEAGEEPAPIINRLMGLVAVVSGAAFVPLVISAHAVVPHVFGSQWTGVSTIFPVLCLGLMVGGPCSTAATGYLFAMGNAKTPRNAVLVQLVVTLVVTLPLVKIIGGWGLGIGVGVGSVADAAVLVAGVTKLTQMTLWPLVRPIASALVAGVPLWIVATWLDPRLLTGVLAALGGFAIYIILLLLLEPAVVRDTLRLSRAAGRATFARETAAAT